MPHLLFSISVSNVRTASLANESRALPLKELEVDASAGNSSKKRVPPFAAAIALRTLGVVCPT